LAADRASEWRPDCCSAILRADKSIFHRLGHVMSLRRVGIFDALPPIVRSNVLLSDVVHRLNVPRSTRLGALQLPAYRTFPPYLSELLPARVAVRLFGCDLSVEFVWHGVY